MYFTLHPFCICILYARVLKWFFEQIILSMNFIMFERNVQYKMLNYMIFWITWLKNNHQNSICHIGFPAIFVSQCWKTFHILERSYQNLGFLSCIIPSLYNTSLSKNSEKIKWCSYWMDITKHFHAENLNKLQLNWKSNLNQCIPKICN